ncbi:uncharacterized protein KY384_005762 [Bacidia gigantensis]|uniref:uncharacterized protein n=1 Tax=Bacidia gigantensis TaxID=2732470 RepID=UPI001D04F046|nr:uncharacterized protein KY384_005762 [Bacidia gigantensis]KAG8529127.1 hypothetical protein KY384_005762 [Bacidia gigantensis]
MARPPQESNDFVRPKNSRLRSDSADESVWTEDDYAKAIDDFSALDSGRGYNFRNLAEFLAPRYPPLPKLVSRSHGDFIAVYELCQQPSTGLWFQNTRQLHSCDDLRHGKLFGNSETTKYIIFLKGFPSPEWLRCIGSTYNIDPEYFRRFLEFGPPIRSARRTSAFALRSSSPKMLTLNVTTVQLLEPSARRDTSSERQRNANNVGMEHYIMSLLRGEAATSDPVVRDYWTVDAKSFVIEQRISIYLQTDEERGDGWNLFIWVDASEDLSESFSGPWIFDENMMGTKRRHESLRTQPIMKYKPMLALKSHKLDESRPGPGYDQPTRPSKQSASTLHIDYGRSLRPNLMACDTLYALREVFELVAQAELQFLSFCAGMLDKFEDTHYSQEPDCLHNLKGLKQLLYRHLHQNQESCTSLENMQSPNWPRASDAKNQQKTEASTQYLKDDFAYLLKMNEQLYKHCTEAIGTLMNEIVIAESREAINQTARMAKLTFLAFIFVPLSFTTSFFGMNFQELGGGPTTLNIWVWFLTCGEALKPMDTEFSTSL